MSEKDIRFRPKTMVSFLGVEKKFLRKVCQSKGNEKIKLMALVSVA